MQARQWLSVRSITVLSVACLFGCFLLTGCASRSLSDPLAVKPAVAAADYQDINAEGDLESVKGEDYVARGKFTIIEFYSPYCPPCMALKPKVYELAMARKDIAVRAINVNRAGIEGIDWESPIIAQNGKFNSLPYIRIYGPDKKLLASGQAATEEVLRALQAQFG
jgi:thiol-disulfide isomerase/thioredoxin